MRYTKPVMLLLLLPALLAAPNVLGQIQPENLDSISAVQFNFSNPGARSLGMGGAFLGLADDATAAYANPAGLTILSRPEVSAEIRSWDFTNEYVEGGHGFFDAAGNPSSGSPTGFGFDTASSLIGGESTDDNSGLSFLSFVYPGERWAVALYRHQLAAFDSSRQTTGAYFTIGEDLFRDFPVRSATDLDVVNYGLSGAYRVTDRLSVGLGVNLSQFELQSVTRHYDWEFGPPEGPGGPFGPPLYTDSNVFFLQRQEGDDDDVTFQAGLLWQISDRWNLGAVYREGGEFEADAEFIAGPSDPGFFDFFFGAVPGDVFDRDEIGFKVPDSYGVGVSFRPTDAVVVALDWNRVQYSQVIEGIDQENVDGGRLVVDDADEIHLGLEYVFFDLRMPLAVRLGVWNDPDHQVRYVGDNPFLRTDFPEGDDEIHYTFGLGLVLGESFQVDAAADFSDLVDTLALSGVYRF